MKEIPVRMSSDEELEKNLLEEDKEIKKPTKSEKNLFIWFLLVIIIMLVIGIVFSISGRPTIEELRNKKAEQLNEKLKVETQLFEAYAKKVWIHSINIENIKKCIELNSSTGTLVDC